MDAPRSLYGPHKTAYNRYFVQPVRALIGEGGLGGIFRALAAAGAIPNIPPRANRKWKNFFSSALCKDRNAIEHMVGSIKDFRRIATRYDKLAKTFLSPVQLAATVGYWL